MRTSASSQCDGSILSSEWDIFLILSSMKLFYSFLCLTLTVFSFHAAHGVDIVWNGVTYDDETVSQLITVITSTSPIPTHPTTKHIYPAQKSLFQIPALARCRKIITFDAVRNPDEQSEENYEQYKQNMIKLTETDPYFSNTDLVFCSSWGCLSGTVKEAMKYVNTPFVFIHQHDLVVKKWFDLNGVIATMVANPNIKYVQFSQSSNRKRPVDEVIEGDHFVPLCRSFGWSDMCHVASVDYYENFVLPQCNNTFMDLVLQPALKNSVKKLGKDEGHRPFGSYLYGNLSDGCFIYHSHGARGNIE